jgi:hypothetical protein
VTQRWYDGKSASSQLRFKTLKVITFSSAATIPLVSLSPSLHWVSAGLGLLIVIVEGIQQLNQYQNNWISYRSTAESLKHEKFLYLATAGPYAASTDPHRLLAERIESLVSQEHAKWASSQEQQSKHESAPTNQSKQG